MDRNMLSNERHKERQPSHPGKRSQVVPWLLRLALPAIFGIQSGVFCARVQLVVGKGAGDLGWGLRSARYLLQGINPYTQPLTYQGEVAYPLTSALAAFPLYPFADEVAAGLFIGLSIALLTYGLLRTGEWWRLLLLLSLPVYHCLLVVNWTILLTAAALLPVLLPLTLCKPQIGLPLLLVRLTRRRLLWCAAFVLLSLAVLPTWPFDWLAQTGDYVGRPMLRMLPVGPLLLLALLRWRSWPAQLLLLLAIVPIRTYYDALPLFLIPRSAGEMAILVGLSWVIHFGQTPFSEHELWTAWLLSLPCLVMVLRRGNRRDG